MNATFRPPDSGKRRCAEADSPSAMPARPRRLRLPRADTCADWLVRSPLETSRPGTQHDARFAASHATTRRVSRWSPSRRLARALGASTSVAGNGGGRSSPRSSPAGRQTPVSCSCTGVLRQVDVVTRALAGEGAVPIRGVLCFVNGERPWFGSLELRGVRVLPPERRPGSAPPTGFKPSRWSARRRSSRRRRSITGWRRGDSGPSHSASARWRSSGEAAGDPAAVGVVEGDEFVGDEPCGLVDLLGGGRRVLVDEQPSQLPQAFEALRVS